MNFSIVLIAKNEAKTLPRMIASLKEFQSRGGEVILMDTGSTDGTPELARSLGCVTHEVGSRFVTTITEELAGQINREFSVNSEPPIVKPGMRLFDYAAARNYAASLASNDVVSMPDCDEAFTRLDLEALAQAITDGAEQLEYNFVYSHDEFGREAIKFLHSKFYDRRKLRWVGVVHEVLQGTANRKQFGEDVIKLEHWQQPSENRSGYLPGLALDCFLNPTNDRNSHYLARELMWNSRPLSAIREFDRHIAMDAWPAEKAQSMIFLGDCFCTIGEPEEGLVWYHRAYLCDGSRREALMRLAHHFWKTGDAQRTATFASAALAVPWNGFYANHRAHYTHEPHELLYWALWNLGDREGSEHHWFKAWSHNPLNSKYLHDARFYKRLPKVSIVIPSLGRPEKLQRLREAIEKNANYPDYEVIVEQDSFENRRGVPKTLKAGVEKSTGELVMFLGNDCIPEKDFLILAVLRMLRDCPDGLVGLNDGYWHGEVATHWLASKKLLPALDGEFFHTGYNHCGCDNELTERCRALDKYIWCSEAKVFHDHPVQTGFKDADMDEVYRLAYDPAKTNADRDLLKARSQQLGFAAPVAFSRPVQPETVTIIV